MSVHIEGFDTLYELYPFSREEAIFTVINFTGIFFRYIHFAAVFNYIYVQSEYSYFAWSKKKIQILSRDVAILLGKTFA